MEPTKAVINFSNMLKEYGKCPNCGSSKACLCTDSKSNLIILYCRDCGNEDRTFKIISIDSDS